MLHHKNTMCPLCPKEKRHMVKVYSFKENWGMAEIVDSLLKHILVVSCARPENWPINDHQVDQESGGSPQLWTAPWKEVPEIFRKFEVKLYPLRRFWSYLPQLLSDFQNLKTGIHRRKSLSSGKSWLSSEQAVCRHRWRHDDKKETLQGWGPVQCKEIQKNWAHSYQNPNSKSAYETHYVKCYVTKKWSDTKKYCHFVSVMPWISEESLLVTTVHHCFTKTHLEPGETKNC